MHGWKKEWTASGISHAHTRKQDSERMWAKNEFICIARASEINIYKCGSHPFAPVYLPALLGACLCVCVCAKQFIRNCFYNDYYLLSSNSMGRESAQKIVHMSTSFYKCFVDCGIYISVCLSVCLSNYLSANVCACALLTSVCCCCAVCVIAKTAWRMLYGVDDIIYDWNNSIHFEILMRVKHFSYRLWRISKKAST